LTLITPLIADIIDSWPLTLLITQLQIDISHITHTAEGHYLAGCIGQPHTHRTRPLAMRRERGQPPANEAQA